MWTPTARALARLHATYVDVVNRAVADDRDDLVTELEQDYARECARLLRTAPPAESPAA